jgi:hypothetical protein
LAVQPSDSSGKEEELDENDCDFDENDHDI